MQAKDREVAKVVHQMRQKVSSVNCHYSYNYTFDVPQEEQLRSSEGKLQQKESELEALRIKVSCHVNFQQHNVYE